MALVMTPIYTQTVTGSSTALVQFNNIPQYFTDLYLVSSLRSSSAGGTDGCAIVLNGDFGTNYSMTVVRNNTGSANSYRFSNSGPMYYNQVPAAGLTTGAFSNDEVWIPNYTGSNFKQLISSWVSENNSTSWDSVMGQHAILWRSTAAITTLRVSTTSGSPMVANSTVSLYGIIRQGA